MRSGPKFFVLPVSRGVVERVQLPASGLRIAEVELLHLLWLDHHNAEVLPCDGVMQVFDLLAQFEVLVVIWFRRLLTRRRASERA